jgi:SAM-dependent methyltransferase
MTQTSVNYRPLLSRYAVYAPLYDWIWGRYSQATLRKAMESAPIKDGSRLIDVACGTGIFAEMLLQRYPNLRITGVDISTEMLEQARERITDTPFRANVEWLQGHAEQLPVASSQFDILTCNNAFHLVQDAPAALAEFRRVLKPGGALVIVDWCRDFPLMKLRTVLMHVTDRQKRQIRTLNELAKLIDDAGFTITRRERFRARRWGLLCLVAQSAPSPLLERDRQPSMPAGWPQYSGR